MSESKILKKNTKVIIGEDEYDLDEDMNINELLEAIRENNPAYSNAAEENCYEDENGNFHISQPKSKTNG